MSDWMDSIVGDRMAVDREFNDRVADSEFSSQEWGLIMTATEFEIEHPEDPDRARLVADTSKLPQMMPEIENIRQRMPAAGGGGGGSAGGSGGILDAVRNALGLGDGADDDRLAEAERLVQEYADALQDRLESTGSWEQTRNAYQE
ncbi:DUF5799 family protein [Halopenitus sp. H-Gu1]|uniref:DUF5799 family protein n=1 Tax=Halopenitus sp. H-Gu1 TaxID=3242697 RepID=UPI00359E7634